MSHTRDLLLPGLWGIMRDRKERWDLDDRSDGGIDIVSESGRTELLTAGEISDGSFKAKFGPRVVEVRETGKWH